VAKGIGYLHSIEATHGDLKSVRFYPPPLPHPADSEWQPNILIDPNGNPRLTDFGLSSVTRNLSANASTPDGRGSIRWRAPELLALSTKKKAQEKVRSARPTSKSDAYSLAMVAIEVKFPRLTQNPVSQPPENLQIFTGRHPFHSSTDEQVIVLLTKGLRPEKPDHEQFTPEMWSLTKKCWDKDPKKRPEISEVLKKLESRDGTFCFVHRGMLAFAQE